MTELFPSTFPSGQGSDLAGVIEEAGARAGGFSPGDEVIGFSNKRASQAELVLVEAGNLTRKPEKVSWEAASGPALPRSCESRQCANHRNQVTAGHPGGP